MKDSVRYPKIPEAYRFEWLPTQSGAEPFDHLHPVLNNTKWDELRLAMYDLSTKTRFRIKTLGNSYISDWDGEWFYHFREGGYAHIEWAERKFTPENQPSVIRELAVKAIPYELSEYGLKVFGHIDDTSRLTVSKL